MSFSNLPDELLLDIIGRLYIKQLLQLVQTCRRLRYICDPRTTTGKRIWQCIRKQEGWPDPNVIGISDFSFCKAYYSRGCHLCDKHPRIRNVRWEYGTLKLCNECFSRVTIPEYKLKQMEIDWGRYGHLPSIRAGPDPVWSALNGNRCYLLRHIPKDLPSAEEAKASVNRREAVERFKQELLAAEAEKTLACKMDQEEHHKRGG
jgi:hypothetical protein